MTDECMSQKSSSLNQSRVLITDERNFNVSLRLGRKSFVAMTKNARSLMQSPSNKTDFLLNPQIIESRNVVNANKSNDVARQFKMIGDSHSKAAVNLRVPEQFSQHSSTSRSSLFNTQVLKQ